MMVRTAPAGTPLDVIAAHAGTRAARTGHECAPRPPEKALTTEIIVQTIVSGLLMGFIYAWSPRA